MTFAHRVGVWGALIAVAVLSLELAGALVWKSHHSTPHISKLQLQKEQPDTADTRRAIAKAERARSEHISAKCLANPLAEGCW